MVAYDISCPRKQTNSCRNTWVLLPRRAVCKRRQWRAGCRCIFHPGDMRGVCPGRAWRNACRADFPPWSCTGVAQERSEGIWEWNLEPPVEPSEGGISKLVTLRGVALCQLRKSNPSKGAVIGSIQKCFVLRSRWVAPGRWNIYALELFLLNYQCHGQRSFSFLIFIYSIQYRNLLTLNLFVFVLYYLQTSRCIRRRSRTICFS